MLSILTNILIFVFVIGFLTFIHELGHFLAAKLVKAKVYEFSLGFGPKLISKKYKGTVYSIRIILLGGFVRILGDGDSGEYGKGKNIKNSSENLKNKSKLSQIFVMLAGVIMNVLFAIVSYYIILGLSNWKTAPIYVDLKGVNIIGAEVGNIVGYEVIPGENSERAGLPSFGVIYEVDNKKINSRDELVEIIKEKEEVDIFVCNDNGSECGRYDVKVNDGKIGVYVLEGSILNYENIKASSGVMYLVNNLKIIFKVLGSMIGNARETGDYSDLSNTVSGPIGVFLLIDSLKNRGIAVFLSLVADLSISLVIMNILPIPALDGGRVFILMVESILRKDLNEKIEAIIINVSMIFLIILIVLIMIKDVVNIDNMRNMLG